MWRMLVFFGLILAAALGVAWIADRPGTVVVTWLGQQREVSVLIALAIVLLVAVLVSLAWTGMRLLFKLPSLIALMSRSRRRQKGFQAVSRGMVAVGSGDLRGARRSADEAGRLLGQEPLAMLLTAQAAQMAGDRAAAQTAFGAMLETAETRVLGLRGLFVEARRSGDAQAARFYAEEAYKLAPSVPWVGEAVLDFRCSEGDWRKALATVEQNASRRLIDRDTSRRQRAVLLAADALDRSQHEPDAALRSALEALKLEPGLVPAAAYAGRRIAEQGDYSKATKILETAWKLSPHPDVAEAYLDVRPGDSALDRLKRARTLLRMNPRAPESSLAVARTALDARELREARQTLEQLVLEAPTVRACRLMAELEELDGGNMGLVREWLARASRAPRDPVWVADGIVSEEWQPLSPVTGKLDAFVWTTPPQAPFSRLQAEIEADRVLADHDEPAVEAPKVIPAAAAPPPPAPDTAATPAPNGSTAPPVTAQETATLSAAPVPIDPPPPAPASADVRRPETV
jgi:HemY protein